MNIEKICKKIIRWGAFLVAFTPLVLNGDFFFPFVGPKSLYFMGLAEVITAAYIILIILNPKYRPKLNTLTKVFIIFLLVSTLSAVLGENLLNSFWSKHERMTGLLTWFHLFPFFIAISSVFKRKDWIKLFEISIFASLVAGAISLFPRIGYTPLKDRNFDPRGGATLGNSSFMATYLLFNAFLSLWLFLISFKEKAIGWFSYLGNDQLFRIFAGGSFAFLAITLFLSTGRAAFMAFLAGLVLFFLLRLIFKEKGKLRKMGIVTLIILLVAGIGVIYFSVQEGDNSIKRIEADAGFNLNDRLAVWNIGIKGLEEKPLLGWGPENYELVFARHFDSRIFLPEYGNDLWYDRAHNIVIDTLATRGILGLISYAAIFGGALYVLWKKFLSDKIYFVTAGVFTSLLLSYFLQNLTVFDMISSYMMFMIVLGFISSLEQEEDENVVSENKPMDNKRMAMIVLVLILFASSFFYFVFKPLKSSNYMIKAIRSEEVHERIGFYEKALETSPLGKYQMREVLERDAYAFLNQEVINRTSIERRKEVLDFVAQELEKNIEESPLLFSSYLKLGRVYNIYARAVDGSKLDRASEVLEKAIEISPTHQQGYWYLSQVKLFQGDLERAIELTEKAIELEPRVEKSHLIAIDAARIAGRFTGDYNKALELANEAININPEWQEDIQNILQK
jgi:O-antigen ligase